MLNLITINECIKIVNINTKTSNHITNRAYTLSNLITVNVCIYKYNCIKSVNINTKTNNYTCSYNIN